MYLKVRKLGMKPGEEDLIVNISKMALIKELQSIIFKEIGVEIMNQRLFYKGKQLVNDHRVVDYDIQLNDVIQLMIRSESATSDASSSSEDNLTKEQDTESTSKDIEIKANSSYYTSNQSIDVIDLEYGAWFEARIVDILKKENAQSSSSEESDLIFRIKLESDEEVLPWDVTFSDIRPRARYTYKKPELSAGRIVLVNYNFEETKNRGYWYDFEIEEITMKFLKGTLFVGKEKTPFKNCSIKFVDEVMKIEKPELIVNRNNEENVGPPLLRKNQFRCSKCKDVATRKCKECGCRICAGKDKPGTIILCDECDYGYHIACLEPPLTEIPSEPEWYCPSCKVDENEIVKAGDKLKLSNKKAKMASAKEGSSNSRDWGRGMACVGRTKECTIVPKDHYGPIPGVEVGTCWKFRLQASEAGVHRPHVAGIHGRETDGAYSLVLSGGYEDDVDNGEEFMYTGSGGRDFSGNKRISEQSCDQTLTRMNKALALNCNAKLNQKGAEAVNWKGGKSVRVVRNYKLGKHSDYAPKDGNRYDGLYKVIKYYPEKGKSGFIVWRYLLRRDDPTPPPWVENQPELEMLYPPGYLEAQAQKQKKIDESLEKKKSSKRVLSDSSNITNPKKLKSQTYKLSNDVNTKILEDETNKKLWEECKERISEGKLKFLSKVEELFVCICCQEIVYLPVTLECKHNVCQSCLKRSFSSGIYNCPYCRFELGAQYKLSINKNLGSILSDLFPGYEAGR